MKAKIWIILFCFLFVACTQATSATQPAITKNAPTRTLPALPTLTPTAALTATPTITPTPAFPVSEGVSLPSMDYPVINPSNISRLQLLAKWGKGRATHAEFSPDGKSVLVASYGGLYLFDADNLDLKTKFTDEAILKAEFLSSGTKVVSLQTASQPDATIKVWDTVTGKQLALKVLEHLVGYDKSLAMSGSPLGETIALNDGYKQIFIMDPDLQILDTLTTDMMTPVVDSWWSYNLDVSDDGSQVLLTDVNSNSPFAVYTVGSKGLITVTKQEHSNIYSMALSPDKKFVVTASGEGRQFELISLTDENIDLSAIQMLFWDAYPDSEQNPIRFTADGKHIYFAHDQGKAVRVIDLEGNTYKDFSRPTNAVVGVSHDGEKAIIASTNLELIDLTTDSVLASKPDLFTPGLDGTGKNPAKMQIAENALILLSADSILRFISLSNGEILYSYSADSFSYSATKHILLIREKGTVSLLDPKTSTVLATADFPDLGDHNGTQDVAISPDGRLSIVYNGMKQLVYVLNSTDLSIQREIPYSWNAWGNPVFKFSPDSNYIITYGLWNRGVTMMKSTSTNFNRILSPKEKVSEFVAFTQDSKKIIYAERPFVSSDTILKWCEFEDGVPSCNSALDNDRFGAFGGCSLSPSGDLFIKFDSSIYSLKPRFMAWNTSSWSKVAEFELVQPNEMSLSGFTPNGQFLINATDTGFIEVWGVKP